MLALLSRPSLAYVLHSISRRLVMMGRYSLLAYIAQIAVIQVSVRLFGRLQPFSGLFFLQVLGVLLLMVVIAEVLEAIRGKVEWLDASYRAVFA